LFEIDHHDIESLHHLIVQRVTQQNEASLVQFVVVIAYDDNSTVRINSFADFSNYSEVRPLRSVAVTLNWVFLIRFQDRPYPEKQEINIRFATPEDYRFEQRHLSDGGVVIYPRSAPEQGLVEAEIHYTARTWGNDVDGLIKGHIENMKKKDHFLFDFFYNKNGWLGFLVFIGVLGLGLYATTVYSDRLDAATRAAIEAQLGKSGDLQVIVIDAIRIFLTREFILGEKISEVAVVILGSVISLVAAITLTVCTAIAVGKLALRSQVILTRQSRAKAEEDTIHHKRKIAGFIGILVLNVLIGLLVVFLGSKLPIY
jgi:hypothetical protein